MVAHVETRIDIDPRTFVGVRVPNAHPDASIGKAKFEKIVRTFHGLMSN